MDANGKLWRKVLDTRRKAVADSESSSEVGKENHSLVKTISKYSQPVCCNCCSCHSEINDTENHKLNRKSSDVSNQSDASRTSSYKSQLEAKVLNEEMNEKLSYDNHNGSKRQAEDLVSVLQEFASYAQSLDIRYKAAERLQKILREIFPEQAVHTETCNYTEILPSKISSIQDLCKKNGDLPKHFYKKCSEFNEKYKEHSEATLNFSYYLKNEKMSNSEMRSLDLEYENLRREFNESKTSVSSQITGIINQKSEVIESCIDSISPLLSDMMEQDRDIYNMLKSFSFRRKNNSTNDNVKDKERCIRRKSDSRVLCTKKDSCCLENHECDF